MDGSLLGEDFTLPIAAAWIISTLMMGALGLHALAGRRRIKDAERQARDE